MKAGKQEIQSQVYKGKETPSKESKALVSHENIFQKIT